MISGGQAAGSADPPLIVMAGLDPAIHVFLSSSKTWMPGTRPGMTTVTLIAG